MREYNVWLNSKGQRGFVYDTPRNTIDCRSFINQDRAEWNTDTKVVTLIYHTNRKLNDYKATIQLVRWMKLNLHTTKEIVTVENHNGSGKRINECCKVTMLWRTKTEPSIDTMLQIQQRIIQLEETAPLKTTPTDDEVYIEEIEATEMAII